MAVDVRNEVYYLVESPSANPANSVFAQAVSSYVIDGNGINPANAVFYQQTRLYGISGVPPTAHTLLQNPKIFTIEGNSSTKVSATGLSAYEIFGIPSSGVANKRTNLYMITT